MSGFARPQKLLLLRRLREGRRFLQVVAGPRQVGKTTLVRQALAELGKPFSGRSESCWSEEMACRWNSSS